MFRLCVGNERNEKIVIGSYPRSENFLNRFSNEQSDISSKFRLKKKKVKANHKEIGQPLYLSEDIEAEIWAPLLSESEIFDTLGPFIDRGYQSLSGMVDFQKIEGWVIGEKQECDIGGTNCDARENENLVLAQLLHKRVAASQSCLFVACILDTALRCIRKILCPEHLRIVYDVHSDCSLSLPSSTLELMNIVCDPLQAYTNQFVKFVLHMSLLGCRMAASRAIKSQEIISEVRSCFFK